MPVANKQMHYACVLASSFLNGSEEKVDHVARRRLQRAVRVDALDHAHGRHALDAPAARKLLEGGQPKKERFYMKIVHE